MQKGRTAIDAISASILFGILAFLSLQLKSEGFVGEVSLVALLIASLVAGFIVFFRKNLKKASFSGGIELQEIKDTEASVKQIAAAVLELAEADEDGIKLESWDEDRYQKAKESIRKLIH